MLGPGWAEPALLWCSRAVAPRWADRGCWQFPENVKIMNLIIYDRGLPVKINSKCVKWDKLVVTAPHPGHAPPARRKAKAKVRTSGRPTADEQGGSLTRFWFPISTPFWRVKTRAEPVFRTKQTNYQLDRHVCNLQRMLLCFCMVDWTGVAKTRVTVASCVVRLRSLKTIRYLDGDDTFNSLQD